MPFSHNGLKTTTGMQVFSQVNKYTVLPILYENVQGCVFAKNRPVSLNWTDYMNVYYITKKKTDFHWLRALTWPVNILSYSLAGARLPVYISY